MDAGLRTYLEQNTLRGSFSLSLLVPMTFTSMLGTWTVVLVILSAFAPAQAFNVTVDDTDPAWVYGLSDAPGHLPWAAVTASNQCPRCKEQPFATQVYNASWHNAESTGNSATISFNGTMGTVYGIVPVVIRPLIWANYSLFINLVPSGSFIQPLSNAYGYNTPLFSFAGLNSSITTTLRIVNNDNGVILLDYLVYDNGEPSQDSSSTATTTSSSIGGTTSPAKTTTHTSSTATTTLALTAATNKDTKLALIVGVVLGVAFLLALVTIFVLWRQMRSLRSILSSMGDNNGPSQVHDDPHGHMPHITPYQADASTTGFLSLIGLGKKRGK